MRHVYPNDEELTNVYGIVKHIDTVIYRRACALGIRVSPVPPPRGERRIALRWIHRLAA